MKKALLFIFGLLISITIYAQDPIFTPAMDINSYGVVDSPFGEEVDKIIDGNINTKFLDFELDDGMGFTVDLGGLSYTATSLEITTANDFEERDPIRYEILGSNDGSEYTSIIDGVMDCIPDRLFSRTYDFVNDISYMYYRVNYTLACDSTGGDGIPSIQVSETQLYGTLLGVNDAMLVNELILYPNPTQDIMYIKSQQDIESLKIYNLQGQLIKEGTSNSVDVSRLTTGLYFILLSVEGKTVTKKFIKE